MQPTMAIQEAPSCELNYHDHWLIAAPLTATQAPLP